MLTKLKTKKMEKESPILMRIFKEEAELEVWKQDAGGLLSLLLPRVNAPNQVAESRSVFW
jgi:murein L,D-transpeptidase YafK